MARLFPLHLIACVAPAFLLASNALAQTAIGGAAVVVNDVRGENAGKRARIALGDRVFANQGVQTAPQSMAKFVFLDDTNMTIGPDSRAKLDSFVFDPAGAGKKISFSATKGAFRFVSGKSPSEAYSVQTPHAHIGVRGTTYDVRVQNGRTLVVLQQGAVNVCLRNSARCRELNQPGQSLVVTGNDIAGPISPANKPWDFGDLCTGRAASLCGVTQFAQVPSPTRRAEAAPPQRKAAPPRKTARAPAPKARPTRVVQTEIVDDEPVYVGRPAPILVGVGAVLPLLHGASRPRPGPGWRPHGALPPSNGGRRPVEPTRPGKPSRIGYDKSKQGGFAAR
ncbi:MAG: FecR domain-containing protein [Beijerinckiaceae bacterium]